MQHAQIIHNPSAGDGEHDKNYLVSLVQNAGYNLHYISTDDKNWQASLLKHSDIRFVAGGDGTVGKVAEVLLTLSPRERQVPLQILPLGTANNIAKSLNIYDLPLPHLVKMKGRLENFDCGRVKGIKNQHFFIESMGLGIFPELIHKMKSEPDKERSQSEEINHNYDILQELVATYQPRPTTLEVDGKVIKGSFLMVELMNIKLLGPNIELVDGAHPADSFFDLVLIPEQSREDLKTYIEDLANGSPSADKLKDITRRYSAKEVSFLQTSAKLHIDDDLILDHSGEKITAKMDAAVFQMKIPKS